jgi:hypothetical protein
MQAFRSIRDEMRQAIIGVTHPNPGPGAAPMVRGGSEPEEDDDCDTHIEPWMELAFEGLTHASETGEPFALVSCYMNSQPAALIAATHQPGDSTIVCLSSWPSSRVCTSPLIWATTTTETVTKAAARMGYRPSPAGLEPATRPL